MQGVLARSSLQTRMEALYHATARRDDLRRLSELQGVAREQLRTPDDGEVLELHVHGEAEAVAATN